MIVRYFKRNGVKVFDVAQALRDSQWGVLFEDILKTKGLRLIDREDPKYQVTVSSIVLDRSMNMYFVSHIEGGWQCLDHAIEQFGRGTAL